MAITLKVNGKSRSVDAEPDTPLLYVLRNDFELNGAKFGCGLAQCGACTVLVNSVATRSCVSPIGRLGQAEITTIEGLGTLEKPHPLQTAFIEEQAAQCGYCINGMIMSAAELLRATRSRRKTTCAPRSPAISVAAAPTIASSARSCAPARRTGGFEMNAPHLTRRDFTAALGGLVLSFSLSPRLALAQEAAKSRPSCPAASTGTASWMPGSASPPTARSPSSPARPNSARACSRRSRRSRLRSSTFRSPTSSMVSADTGRTPNEGQTAGSQSIDQSGTALRMAGAEVRAILLDLAAKKFGVGADVLSVAEGVITAPNGRKVGYGELAAEADLKREATAKAKPKPPAQHKIVGTPVQRFDIPRR